MEDAYSIQIETVFLLLHYYRIKWAITLVGLLILSLAFLFNKITGGYIFRYSEEVVPEKKARFLLGLQWIASLLSAVSLPNNFLSRIPYFRRLFEENELWIPVSMILILLLSLLFWGVLFHAALGLLPRRKH
jgi:hypothetical protein